MILNVPPPHPDRRPPAKNERLGALGLTSWRVCGGLGRPPHPPPREPGFGTELRASPAMVSLSPQFPDC